MRVCRVRLFGWILNFDPETDAAKAPATSNCIVSVMGIGWACGSALTGGAAGASAPYILN